MDKKLHGAKKSLPEKKKKNQAGEAGDMLSVRTT